MKEEARGLLAKAERALGAARTLLASGDTEFAADRAYYAMLHAAQALLRQEGCQYRKRSGVHAVFGERYIKRGLLDVKFHRWLLDAFDERLRGDYDIAVEFAPDTVATRIEQAQEFIAAIKELLGSAAG